MVNRARVTQTERPHATRWHLDLRVIQAALFDFQAAYPLLSKKLKEAHDVPTGEIISNMLDGYRYIDSLHQQQVDLFAMGNSARVLELNLRVLCGVRTDNRKFNRSYIQATEEHFYATGYGGFARLISWYKINRALPPYDLAAGIYMQVLKQPQLFIEGNHRCGALLADYVLLRSGKPPFILDRVNAVEYFSLTDRIKNRGNSLFWRIWLKRALQKKLASLLQRYATDRKYLLLSTR